MDGIRRDACMHPQHGVLSPWSKYGGFALWALDERTGVSQRDT